MHFKQRVFQIFLLGSLGLLWTACSNQRSEKTLPYLGFHDVVGTDTVYHKIPPFQFLDQDSTLINNEVLGESIYIADFFYTYCPSVCPKVKQQMLRVYEHFPEETPLKLVSFALDPSRDSVLYLRGYANNLGVESERWHFLSGDVEETWSLARDFLISVQRDSDEPGGITHSGKLILVDRQGHIRGFADGTDPGSVDRFLEEVEFLLVHSELE
ncbi:MAG: SCO family protein [Bacteroidota bacterium]